MKFLKLLFVGIMIFTCYFANGQKFSVSTNMLEYINFMTFNVEGSLSVSRHFSMNVNARYNPFTFGRGENIRTNRQNTCGIGAKYWLWYVHSGWWLSSKIQMQEYNRGGLFSKYSREGNRYGIGFGAGYSYMLSKHINLDFGFALWSGMDYFKKYDCSVCGMLKEKGKKWFLLPDDFTLSIGYVF